MMGAADTAMMGGGQPAGRHYGMACAACHGPLGEGGRILAMGSARTPSIRYAMLTGQEERAEEDDGEDGHAHQPYDDEGIARAITHGLDMEGEELSGFMPRWTMSPADLAAGPDRVPQGAVRTDSTRRSWCRRR